MADGEQRPEADRMGGEGTVEREMLKHSGDHIWLKTKLWRRGRGWTRGRGQTKGIVAVFLFFFSFCKEGSTK